MLKENKREFILVDKKEEAEGIFSLYFKTVNGKEFNYIPGQYVNIKPSIKFSRSKSYTISSIPSEKYVCITIKKKGDTSSTIIDLNIGDNLVLEGPYGNFYPETEDKDVVMIAGGIGVTPFFSIIKDKLKSAFKKKILLFYSNKTIKKAAFFEEFNTLSKDNKNFEIIYCLTEEKTGNKNVKEFNRIDEKMIKNYIASLNDKCYYICGSVGFVNDMWKSLKNIGVLEEDIFTESFF